MEEILKRRQGVSSSSQGKKELTSKGLFGVIRLIVTLIWPWSICSTSVLCSATSLAMSETIQRSVSWLLAVGCMLTQKPKSITVSWKSPAHLWMSIASTVWKMWALQAFCTLLQRSLIPVGPCFIHSYLIAGWAGGQDGSVVCRAGVLFLSHSVNDSDSVSLSHQGLWFPGERLLAEI